MAVSVASEFVARISARNLCQPGLMNGWKVNFINEIKEVNNLSFPSEVSESIVLCARESLEKKPSNIKPMAQAITC